MLFLILPSELIGLYFMHFVFLPLLAPFRFYALIAQFIRRDVLGRYRGSLLGLGWSFLTPLLMLGVYSFVFIGVFKARWPGVEQGDGVFFAIRVFCGLVVFNFVAEILARSPTVITEQPNLVKKVVFPLDALPVVVVGSALFHFLLSMLVLLAGVVAVQGFLPLTALALPIVFLPLLVQMLGLSWILAGLGVYVRDIGPVMGMVSSLLMFLSPVFYSLEAVSEKVRGVMLWLPTTPVIENFRRLLFEGLWPDWHALVLHAGIALVVVLLGASFFGASRRGFADVL